MPTLESSNSRAMGLLVQKGIAEGTEERKYNDAAAVTLMPLSRPDFQHFLTDILELR